MASNFRTGEDYGELEPEGKLWGTVWDWRMAGFWIKKGSKGVRIEGKKKAVFHFNQTMELDLDKFEEMTMKRWPTKWDEFQKLHRQVLVWFRQGE